MPFLFLTSVRLVVAVVFAFADGNFCVVCSLPNKVNSPRSSRSWFTWRSWPSRPTSSLVSRHAPCCILLRVASASLAPDGYTGACTTRARAFSVRAEVVHRARPPYSSARFDRPFCSPRDDCNTGKVPATLWDLPCLRVVALQGNSFTGTAA